MRGQVCGVGSGGGTQARHAARASGVQLCPAVRLCREVAFAEGHLTGREAAAKDKAESLRAHAQCAQRHTLRRK